MRKIDSILLMVFATLFSGNIFSQEVGIKTNLVYGSVAYAPNLGVEVALGKRSTLNVEGGYNGWNRKGNSKSNKKLVHWLGGVEYRYWFCQKFDGHFIGAQALGGQYNISGHNLPMMFDKHSARYRHEGWGVGAGVVYGYEWVILPHFNIEAAIGAGYLRLNYDKYDCENCGKELSHNKRNYFGPTKAALSLIYIF